MIEEAIKTGKYLTLCTIYDPYYENPVRQMVANTALAGYNDVITRTANKYGLDIIDLRNVITQPEDYANPIEPSEIGGAKFATEILTVTSKQRIRKEQDDE